MVKKEMGEEIASLFIFILIRYSDRCYLVEKVNASPSVALPFPSLAMTFR